MQYAGKEGKIVGYRRRVVSSTLEATCSGRVCLGVAERCSQVTGNNGRGGRCLNITFMLVPCLRQPR